MWSAEYDSAERALQDTGAVVRIPNPFDKSKDVMMVLGCDTFGVLAASLVISSRPDAKDARRGLGKRLGWRRYFGMPAFAAIVHCDVLGNDIGAVTLTHSLRIRPTQPIVKVKDASAAK
jgi:hypothetical protein